MTSNRTDSSSRKGPEPRQDIELRGEPGRRIGPGSVVLLVLSMALIALLGVAVFDSSSGLVVGEPAPEFTLETFDGASISLSELRGQIVVLNFWASWCETCKDEASVLEAVSRDYKDRGVVVLGVDYTDTRPAALEYLERYSITYPNGRDRADIISRRYGLTGVPETVIIDADGRIVPLALRGRDAPRVAKLDGPIVAGAPFTPDDLRRLLDELVEAQGEGATNES